MRSSKVQILVKALVLLMLLSSIAISQENSRTCGFTLKSRILKQKDYNSVVQYFAITNSIDFGYYHLNGNDPERVYRSIYEVDLPKDLPAGALITKVELIYQNNGNYSGEKFAIYNIPITSYDNTWGGSKRWEITESGSFLQEYGVYSGSTLTVGVATLQDIANEALESGKTKLYLGFRAYPESGQYDTHVNNFASVSLKYTYEIVVRHTLNNSNGLGNIDVNINNYGFSEVNSGHVLMVTAGSTVQLRAKEEQFDGSHYWVWNQDPNTLDATKSKWTDEKGLVFPNREFTYTTDISEIYKTFTAQLKRKFLINRIDKTEFDGNFQTNDVTRVVEGNSVNIPYPETLTKTTGTYNFAGWESGGGSLKTPTDNTTYTALYKMSQLSNTQSAFSNSSQRKFIMTPQANHPYGGDLHLVYESMGKIWYERSIDGGATWTLQNNGKPINTDYVFGPSGEVIGTGSYTTAKHPALDYYGNRVLVVWQEQSGNNYVVRLAFLENGQPKPANSIPFTSYGLYTEDIYPEIAVKDNGFAVIAIRRNDSLLKGLEVHFITLVNADYGMASEETSGWIPGTDQNTGSFTIATDRNYTDKYHIAWQQNGTSASSMQYTKFNFIWLQGEEPKDGYYAMNLFQPINVSNSTSYTRSYSPSMIGVSDGTARLAFKGYRVTFYGGIYSISSVCPDNLSWIPYLRKYSGEVFSPQISQGSQTYFVGWTEFYGGSYKTIATDASTLSNKETLGDSFGRDMQINNGGTKLQQLSIGFNSEATSLPYSFKPTAAIGDIQVNKKAPVLSGRGIFLTKDDLQMYFILGNVTSGGININFINVKDTIKLDGSLKKVNSCLITEPFSLKDNSSLTFAVNYGFRDSSASKSLMKTGDAASFKVEMIDDASGRVLGTYMDVRMDKDNIFNSKEGIFKIGSDGIVNKPVRLRISVDENMKSQYTIAEMLFDEGLPLSKSLKELELNSSLEIKEYSLSQNYPNPFNPTTVINYALPKASKVSLKIYDILGKEVATLVNGYEEMGKYSVEFNASNLPSGIYIFEIRANDFVKSGKMMLLK